MKKIKKIVLRSATKLTNSEMKKLRGGYAPGNNRPSSCIIPCPDGFGGGSVELDCSKSGGGYCDIYSGVNSYGIPYYGVACFAEEGMLTDRNVKELCQIPELFK